MYTFLLRDFLVLKVALNSWIKNTRYEYPQIKAAEMVHMQVTEQEICR